MNKPLLLKALAGEKTTRPPVWIMRQAGRYLSEYCELKERYGFNGICRNRELTVQVSMQPVRYLDVDAAIIFSDILIPLQAMGIEIEFTPGPKIANPIKTRADIEALDTKDVIPKVQFVFDAIQNLRQALADYKNGLEKAVIGFAGAPWTLACYVLDQGPVQHFHGTQVFAYENRSALMLLLEKLTTVIIDYTLAQVESGAQVIQLFDTWAGNLSAADYQELALPYVKRIIAELTKRNAPSMLYVNGSSHLLPQMTESGATCLSVDWRTSLTTVQEILARDNPQGGKIVLQGNLDPSHLYGSAAQVRNRTRAMIESLTEKSGYIANLGHGILPTTPRENALAFVEAVKEGW